MGASLITQLVKNLPAMQAIWVRFLGQEDPLEKEMATHSNILAWKIPGMEEPGRATVHGVARSRTRLSDFTFLSLYFYCTIFYFPLFFNFVKKQRHQPLW